MGALILVPWPETIWSAAGRLAGRTPVSLSDAGRARAQAWAEILRTHSIDTLYRSAEQASVETAQVLAGSMLATVIESPELAEVDVGLWDGLTGDELKRRYPKIYKRWENDPSAVCPPEGESLSSAQERIGAAVDDLTAALETHTVALVLGPFAFGIARCVVESVDLTQVRHVMFDRPLRYPVLPGTQGELIPIGAGLNGEPSGGRSEPTR